MTESEIIDLPLLQGYLDNLGQPVLEKMLALYRQQSQNYLVAIKEALALESQEDWQERCHKMKGAAGSAGLKQVHALLCKIEKSTDEWSRKQQYVIDLEQRNVIGIKAFSRWLE